MKNQINIAEILKDCPQGMELDCVLCDNVVLEKVDFNSYRYPIVIRVLKTNTTFNLSKYGQFIDEEDYRCIIFPKGKTTWEEFIPPCQFKAGDVIVTRAGNIGIIKERAGVKYLVNCTLGGSSLHTVPLMSCIERLATEEEKKKLLQAIKNAGYKLNEETKTLERLIEPRFKVGDRIKSLSTYYQYDIKELTDTHYTLVEVEEKFEYTEPILEDKNWELVPNKFDITTLKPFDKVLVRHDKDNTWCASLFSHMGDNLSYCYKFVTTAGKSYPMCIPYKGNEHLLGTTNDCNDFYKIWE